MHDLWDMVQPPNVPTTELLEYFACHCAWVLHLSYHTIKLYFSGVRHHYIENGAPNPLTTLNGQPLFSLELILRGIRKHNSPQASNRLPITFDVLVALGEILNGKTFGFYGDTLLKTVCSVAFFGFLRCGEFTTNSMHFDPEVNLCLNDITISRDLSNTEFVSLHLKQSKTDPFSKGYHVYLHQVTHSICPVSCVKQYLQVRTLKTANPFSPLFMLDNGNALNRYTFLHMLTTACTQAGINPSGFTGHSFRIGAATTAAKCNVADHMIQTLGRWTSDCYKTYIRTPLSKIAKAQQAMCSWVAFMPQCFCIFLVSSWYHS